MTNTNWEFDVSKRCYRFANPDLESFLAYKISTTTREIIQNSGDAVLNSDEPVSVFFKIKNIYSEELIKLRPFIGRSEVAQKDYLLKKGVIENELSHDPGITAYGAALERIDKSNSNKEATNFLVIHDFNTHGLVDRAWDALLVGSGDNYKNFHNNESSLGSKGMGAKSQFLLSQIRTVFYYSKFKSEDNKIIEKFMGKSCLQSHYNTENQNTDCYGYYGDLTNDNEGATPLFEEKIPSWASEERRNACGEKTGTSIFIPLYNFDEEELDEIVISAIGNFYYTFYQNKLRLIIQGRQGKYKTEQIIDKDSLDSWYKKLRDDLENQRDEIDYKTIEKNFESIRAINEIGALKGVENVEDGVILKWHLLLDENLKKSRVVIARGRGMIITDKAPSLDRIPRNLKKFIMFVSIDGDEGSKLLEQAEDATHSKLNPSIIGRHAKGRYKTKYDKIVKAIKNIYEKHTKTELNGGLKIDFLDSLLNNLNTSADLEGDEKIDDRLIEPLQEKRIKKEKNKPFKFSPKDEPTDDPMSPTEKEIHQGLMNIRIKKGDGKKITLFFDKPKTDSTTIKIVMWKVSPDDKEKIGTINGKFYTEKDISDSSKEREECQINLAEDISNFKLQATHILKER